MRKVENKQLNGHFIIFSNFNSQVANVQKRADYTKMSVRYVGLHENLVAVCNLVENRLQHIS